jgi:hypothetical protein
MNNSTKEEEEEAQKKARNRTVSSLPSLSLIWTAGHDEE